MASVSESPLSSLAEALWPSELTEGVTLVDDGNEVRVETDGGEASELKEGDVIVKINNKDVRDRSHAIRLLGRLEYGSLVKVTIISDTTEEKTIEVLNPVNSGEHMLLL